jgi:outer membrane protein assembly factor BamA
LFFIIDIFASGIQLQILEKSSSNKKNNFLRILLLISPVILILYSCNPTKYVPEGETLLNNNYIEINKTGISKTDLVPYIKQKPNKKIFGARFHLGLYNLSNLNKEKWPHSWLRNIGEEPVIYDKSSATKSREQLEEYISSKGYFDSRVSDSVRTVKRKSDVFYDVHLKEPYTVRNLYFEIADTTIETLFCFDSINCLIQRGKPYDVDVLQAERSRFERYVKDHGFYGFSAADHISFRVDSTIGNRQVNLYYDIKKFQKIDNYNRITYVPHSVYRIKNVYIYPDFVPKDVLEGGETYLRSLDTVNYNGYYFITDQKKPQLKYDLILQSLYLKPGSDYSISNSEQTQSHLMTLKAYRLVNIFYNEAEAPDNTEGSQLFLDCHIQLTQLSQQSFNVELEGTNSAGNLGGALNLVYQHKNLLHGAEQFNMKLKGAFEAMPDKTGKLRPTQEYGFETSLRLPKFLVPFMKKEGFIKNYNPTTTILAAYNYQDMPFYTRTIANATFGYNWSGHKYRTHIVNPVQLNVVRLISIDTAFQKKIDASSYLAYSYRDVMILGSNYSFIFNNQKIQKSKDYLFLRVNAEAAGNLLSAASRLTGAKKTEGTYNILGQPFAQYIRTDLDLRYNVILNDVSSVVYRGFIGLGIPYGNSKAIPFEKQYFGGGANGIRAWQVRSLGPGSYVPGENEFLNQTADIKLEANAEYRFKLFWVLEGALFLDAGNIWTFNEDASRPGAQFKFNKFFNDIAVGTGTGFRFDFDFVTARIDMGMKLRDPSISNGSNWILMSRRYNFRDDFAFVLGIGYPF